MEEPLTCQDSHQDLLVLARRSAPHRTARTRVGATIWGSLIKAPLNYGFGSPNTVNLTMMAPTTITRIGNMQHTIFLDFFW